MTSHKRIPLPDPSKPRTWPEQMSIQKISPMRYESLAGAPFGAFVTKNGEARARAFGGHVYAQAAWAASKTVGEGFVIHSMSGYFTILGLADEPFMYDISVIRNGGNYCVRRVEVWQGDSSQVCFSGMCSFKKPEMKFLNVQEEKVDMEKKYASILGNKRVKDLPLRSDFKDMRAALETQQPCISTTFPAMYTSLLPLETMHKTHAPIARTNLYIYSTMGPAPTPSQQQQDANLDACAHLYHSDRESIWSLLRSYELLDVLTVASSLSHTVIFHGGPSKLAFHDARGGRRWFFQETTGKRLSDGRGLHEGRIYDCDGNHVVTTMQDGALKLNFGDEGEMARRERALQRGAAKI